MMQRLGVAAALLAAIVLAGALRAQAQVAAPAPSLLPEATGRATLVRVCSSCHTPELAARQRLTPAGWKELVGTMADQGAVATDQELADITAYLSKAFPDGEAGLAPAAR